MSRQPNFFILGAPKCGTTALAEYLRQHPRVFMSTPKEPHYFCDDFDYYYAPGQRSLDHYLRLFEDADERHLAVGEASVWYLYSQTAAANIAAFAPEARAIVMVRNPLELVPSLHGQLLYEVDEDVADVATAWALQGARARGEHLPPSVRVPAFLQYGAAASLAGQLERVYASIPRERVLVIVFDDLRADAGAVYRRTLEFLGVPDDGRTEFPRVNPNTVHRAPRVAKLTQRPPRAALAAARAVKKVTGIRKLGVLDRVRSRNRVVAERAPLAPEFLAELANHFHADVARLSELIDRDLTGWTAIGDGTLGSTT
ncbi:MAG TPA: sulfotransferase [Miltoncostaeaceae bacterium]|nr:sulfotransferase [Miltoncostaeaceae bacterium]